MASERVRIGASAPFEALAVAFWATLQRMSKKSTSFELRLWKKKKVNALLCNSKLLLIMCGEYVYCGCNHIVYIRNYGNNATPHFRCTIDIATE